MIDETKKGLGAEHLVDQDSTPKPVILPEMTCPKCHGDGVRECDDGRREVECLSCGGTGKVPYTCERGKHTCWVDRCRDCTDKTCDARAEAYVPDCPECLGHGGWNLHDGKGSRKTCPACNGTGKAEVVKEVEGRDDPVLKAIDGAACPDQRVYKSLGDIRTTYIETIAKRDEEQRKRIVVLEAEIDQLKADKVMKKYDRETIAAKDSGYIIYMKNAHAQLAYMHVAFINNLVTDVQFFMPQSDPAEDEPYEIDAPDFWCKLDFDAYLASKGGA